MCIEMKLCDGCCNEVMEGISFCDSCISASPQGGNCGECLVPGCDGDACLPKTPSHCPECGTPSAGGVYCCNDECNSQIIPEERVVRSSKTGAELLESFYCQYCGGGDGNAPCSSCGY
jgi:hypothetical protein